MTYRVSPDGQRFVIAKPVNDHDIKSYRVVLNWFEEVRALTRSRD